MTEEMQIGKDMFKIFPLKRKNAIRVSYPQLKGWDVLNKMKDEYGLGTAQEMIDLLKKTTGEAPAIFEKYVEIRMPESFSVKKIWPVMKAVAIPLKRGQELVVENIQ